MTNSSRPSVVARASSYIVNLGVHQHLDGPPWHAGTGSPGRSTAIASLSSATEHLSSVLSDIGRHASFHVQSTGIDTTPWKRRSNPPTCDLVSFLPPLFGAAVSSSIDAG